MILGRRIWRVENKKPFQLEVASIRLVKDSPICSERPITMPEHAVELVGRELCDMDREVVCIINLRADGVPINCNFASIGALDQACIYPRELFKTSILSNAARMIIVHNHPSGNLYPSEDDTRVTDRMIKLCKLMCIPLRDHIIVGGDTDKFFSFNEKGLIYSPYIRLESDYKKLDKLYPQVAEKRKGR